MNLFAATLAILLAAPTDAPRPFKIAVVDEQTGRGVPLVELETVNNIRLLTDSSGLVAFDEPGLMDQSVFFHVRSHGYEFPKDGFGIRGKALDVTMGGSATLKVKRINVAERLYRVTGGGIYRDTVLLGEKPPTRDPVLNGQVFGQDSVLTATYGGKLRWFWGDTNRPGYPLGNFNTPGATSRLPSDGGLDPEVGVDLTYFVDAKGFAKATAKMPGEGPTWISGLTVLRDESGSERVFAGYVKVRPPLSVYEHGLIEWDDESDSFRKVTTFPEGAPIYPDGHPFPREVGGKPYVYFAQPFPWTRVPADPDALKDLSKYEAFTCLKPGSRRDQPEVERDADGRVIYRWKANAPTLGPAEQDRLVKDGKLKPGEGIHQLRDIETGKRVIPHNGSTYWNDHRRRWIAIFTESFGTSALGEIWYAEADRPEGPWVYARKVVTHDTYSFYNPKQHPYFAKDDSRTLFFEGTYTASFSGNEHPTPRYDYNQIMYKLDLDDPGLNLPVAVDRLSAPARPDRFGTIRHPDPPGATRSLAFFALERPRPGSVAFYEEETQIGSFALTSRKPDQSDASPVFHALPAESDPPPPGLAPLFEFVGDGGARTYSTDPENTPAGYHRSPKPLCLVWPNPLTITLPRD